MLAEARETAGLSQECAAGEAHIGRRSLSRYEDVPEKANPQVILKLAEIYNSQELVEWYCTNVCEIGKEKHCKIQVNDLSTAGLRWLKELQDSVAIKDRLLSILCDGKIDAAELPELHGIMSEIDELESALHALKIKVSKEVDNLTKKEKPPVLAHRRLSGY